MVERLRQPTPEASETDWGTVRSPFDIDGDGSIARIALPEDAQDQNDDDGFDSQFHPCHLPKEDPMSKELDNLTDAQRDALLETLIEKNQESVKERDALALEKDRFNLEKDRTKFAMFKNMTLGFGTVLILAFIAFASVITITSFNKGTFADIPVVTAVLSTFTEVLKLVFSTN